MTTQDHRPPSVKYPHLAQRLDDREHDRAYQTFLMYCIAGEERGLGSVGKVMGVPKPTVQVWRKKFDWYLRVDAGGPDIPLQGIEALQEFAAKVALRRINPALKMVLDNGKTGIPYVPDYKKPVDQPEYILRENALEEIVEEHADASASAVNKIHRSADRPDNAKAEIHVANPDGSVRVMTEDDPELPADVRVALQEARTWERIRREFLGFDAVQMQVRIIDAALITIAKRIRKGEIRVSVADLPRLVKARQLLTGGFTSRVALGPAGEQQTGPAEVPQESIRLALAKKTGDESAVLDALEQDATELQSILQAVKNSRQIHQQAQNHVVIHKPESTGTDDE